MIPSNNTTDAGRRFTRLAGLMRSAAVGMGVAT